jgi:hypothetical protein
MTDTPEDIAPERDPERDADDVARPQPSSAAAAARRARRIGGRPVTAGVAVTTAGAGPAGAPPPEPADSNDPTAPVALRKRPGPPVLNDSAGEQPLAPDDDLATIRRAVPAWLDWAPAGVLAAGVAVMAVLLIVISHGVWWAKPGGPGAAEVNRTREQVLAAAKSCIVTLNQYSYTDLNGYERDALACTTGRFTSQLKDSIDKVVKPSAPALKAKQTAQVNRGAIESVSADGRQWTVVLFLQLSVVNANYPKGRTDPLGAVARMEKVKGRWLISSESPVSSPIPG